MKVFKASVPGRCQWNFFSESALNNFPSDIRGSIILVYLPKMTALIKPTKLTESTKLEEIMCENRIDFRKILIEEIK